MMVFVVLCTFLCLSAMAHAAKKYVELPLLTEQQLLANRVAEGRAVREPTGRGGRGGDGGSIFDEGVPDDTLRLFAGHGGHGGNAYGKGSRGGRGGNGGSIIINGVHLTEGVHVEMHEGTPGQDGVGVGGGQGGRGGDAGVLWDPEEDEE